MATSNTDLDTAAIFNRLDDIFASSSYTGQQATNEIATTEQLASAKKISASTSDKSYRLLTAHSNVTSFSKLENLHNCQRLYELEELKSSKAVNDNMTELGIQGNIDFAYGHAVGAGIQTYGATGSLIAAQFAAFLAWKAPYDADKLDKQGKSTGKNLDMVIHAISKFQFFMDTELADWEVLVLPDGKPAVELSFAVDTENGYFHFGHIDVVLIHRKTKRLAVWEGKTTGNFIVSEAAFANSYQALGYSVVVDAIAATLGLTAPDYEVLYIVYSSNTREFHLLPFTKSRTQRAEWLQALLLDHAMIEKYKELGFFPKNGSHCLNKYGRTCEFFGNCGMRNSSLYPRVETRRLESIDELERLDFKFTLTELVAAQETIRSA